MLYRGGGSYRYFFPSICMCRASDSGRDVWTCLWTAIDSAAPAMGVMSVRCEICEHDILKTDEPILLQIGISGPRGKGMQRSTLGVRRSNVKVTWGIILDPLGSISFSSLAFSSRIFVALSIAYAARDWLCDTKSVCPSVCPSVRIVLFGNGLI